MKNFSPQMAVVNDHQRRYRCSARYDNKVNFGVLMPFPIRVCPSAKWPIWILCCICAFSSYAASSGVLSAKIVAYGSGSAFAVLDKSEKLKRIKLSGVDSPGRKQPFAAQAKHLAAEWLGTSAFEIVIDKTDQDGRIHGRALVDGHDIGFELIKAGLAWCDPADIGEIPPEVREKYRQECILAKTERRGLWQDQNPVPPWEDRKIPQFEPLPSTEPTGRSCRDIGHQSVQCDDGKTYRIVGHRLLGSDGTSYSRRGNTLIGSDGSRFEQQGTSTYGSDGTICRTRGRQTDCF